MKHSFSTLSLLAATVMLGSLASTAHANSVQMQQATGYYMSTCGGPTPAHCTPTSTNGRNYYDLLGFAWGKDSKGQDKPYFYKMPRRYTSGNEISSDAWRQLESDTLKRCQSKFGTPCEYQMGYNSTCVAVAYNSAEDFFVWQDDEHFRCSQAKKAALQLCKNESKTNPKACKVVETAKHPF
ncbi:MAG: DUF4189 domain-containing protein [Moraxella sp.]|nr:DUF4189 domain-containing protein [Moraxella sp.]